MKRTIIKRTIIVFSTFIGILLVLPLLQFSNRQERFVQTNGAFQINGAYNIRQNGVKELSRIFINTIGAEFHFTPGSLQSEAQDSKTITESPVSWKTTCSKIQITFSKGSIIEFQSDAESQFRILIKNSSAKAIRIPVQFTGSVEQKPDNVQNYEISSRTGLVTLSSDSISTISPRKNALVFTSKNNSFGQIAFQSGKIESVGLGAFTALQVQSEGDFRVNINKWIDKAYSAWEKTRYNKESGNWTFGDSEPRFNENTMIAYLAEALRRNVFTEAKANIQTSISNYSYKFTWLSSPFFGSMSKRNEKMVQDDAIEAKRIQNLVQAKDIRVFETEHLILKLVDRSSQVTLKETLLFALEAEIPKDQIKAGAGILECYLEASKLLKDEDNSFKKHETIAERILIPAIKKTQQGYFVQTVPGQIDTLLNIRIGTLLLEYGKISEKPVFVAIGQNLIDSVLALSDDQGYTPQSLTLSNNLITETKGLYPSELFYPLISENSFYPHEVSFYKELGQGSWAWTNATNLSVQSETGKLSFIATFPSGLTHYVIFKGIKPFIRIQLYNIDYRTDPQFETYDSSGWLYKDTNQTLFVKMKHKSSTEAVRMYKE